MARRERDMARTRSVHSQPKQHGPDKEEAETLLDLHKQYIRLYYSCIAKRLGVDASYINRVANGEHQMNFITPRAFSGIAFAFSFDVPDQTGEHGSVERPFAARSSMFYPLLLQNFAYNCKN
jgi:hypothetical protein